MRIGLEAARVVGGQRGIGRRHPSPLGSGRAAPLSAPSRQREAPSPRKQPPPLESTALSPGAERRSGQRKKRHRPGEAWRGSHRAGESNTENLRAARRGPGLVPARVVGAHLVPLPSAQVPREAQDRPLGPAENGKVKSSWCAVGWSLANGNLKVLLLGQIQAPCSAATRGRGVHPGGPEGRPVAG